MGYFVETVESSFTIKKANYDKAYKAVCELNAHDELKRGGCWGGNKPVKPADSKSVSNSPDKWFSWMPWNYDETCKDIIEVLEELGFYVGHDCNGIDYLSYDNKTGNEDVFFAAMAPYIEDGSHIIWKGEDGSMWVWEFENGEMQEHDAHITW